jgi:hypothetical protein
VYVQDFVNAYAILDLILDQCTTGNFKGGSWPSEKRPGTGTGHNYVVKYIA